MGILAFELNISISSFTIIYDLREAVEALINEILGPIVTIEEVGKVEVKKIFTIDKSEMIAGSYVTEGKITKGDHVKIIRNEDILAESIIANSKFVELINPSIYSLQLSKVCFICLCY